MYSDFSLYSKQFDNVKFIYSEKAKNFCDKSTVEISQNFVAFSEYMNFLLFVPKILTIHIPSLDAAITISQSPIS